MSKRRLPAVRLPAGLPRWLGTQIVRAALGLLIVYFLYDFVSLALEDQRLSSQISELERENAQLAADGVALEGELAYTQSDAFVERAAREQLGMVREGDTVLVPQVVAVTPTPPRASVPAPAPAPVEAPNWRRWLQALAGRP